VPNRIEPIEIDLDAPDADAKMRDLGLTDRQIADVRAGKDVQTLSVGTWKTLSEAQRRRINMRRVQ
jgi:hypothetical protein